MASKLATAIESASDLKLANTNRKMPPIDPNRKLNKLKQSDSLVAKVEKIPVPNHALETSLILFFDLS
jgi:hypothetical protein